MVDWCTFMPFSAAELCSSLNSLLLIWSLLVWVLSDNFVYAVPGWWSAASTYFLLFHQCTLGYCLCSFPFLTPFFFFFFLTPCSFSSDFSYIPIPTNPPTAPVEKQAVTTHSPLPAGHWLPQLLIITVRGSPIPNLNPSNHYLLFCTPATTTMDCTTGKKMSVPVVRCWILSCCMRVPHNLSFRNSIRWPCIFTVGRQDAAWVITLQTPWSSPCPLTN